MKVIGMNVMVRLKVSLSLFCCKFCCVCVVAEVYSKLLLLWVVAA